MGTYIYKQLIILIAPIVIANLLSIKRSQNPVLIDWVEFTTIPTGAKELSMAP